MNQKQDSSMATNFQQGRNKPDQKNVVQDTEVRAASCTLKTGDLNANPWDGENEMKARKKR
jgi:hypothetical protein